MNAEALLGILRTISSLLNWLQARGVPRDNAIALLQLADEENRDVTTAEVQAELDATANALDATEDAIDNTFDPSD